MCSKPGGNRVSPETESIDPTGFTGVLLVHENCRGDRKDPNSNDSGHCLPKTPPKRGEGSLKNTPKPAVVGLRFEAQRGPKVTPLTLKAGSLKTTL